MEIEFSYPSGRTERFDFEQLKEAVETLARFAHSTKPAFARLLTLHARNRPDVYLSPDKQLELLCAIQAYKNHIANVAINYARLKLTADSDANRVRELQAADAELLDAELTVVVDPLFDAVFQNIKDTKKKETPKKFAVRVVLEEVSSDTLLEKIKRTKHLGIKRVDLTAAELALVPAMVQAKKIASRNVLGRVVLIADSELL